MTKRTEALLRASIDHWARLVEQEGLDDERWITSDCPLCKEFYAVASLTCCKGCPIADHTGHTFCDDTPWEAAADALGKLKFREYATAKERRTWKAQAGKMLEFLVNLLPEKKQ